MPPLSQRIVSKPEGPCGIGRPAVDDGYFPRGRSVLRRVQGERIVGLMYGQRALMIGAAHPINYTGTSLSTEGKQRPFNRLVHTGKIFETVFFGTRAEADRALAFVQTLHERVNGSLPDDAGRFPAGTTYSAFDPDLMLWTVAVIADSAQVLYETLVRRLSHGERDALWQDYVRFGELFGMPRAAAPASYRDFRAYWDDMLASDTMHLTAEARAVGAQVAFHIPVPLRAMPALQVHNLVLLGTVPQRIRRLYGLRWTPAHEAAFRSATTLVRRARPIAPHDLRRGWNTTSFDLVARTERRRLRAGKQTVVFPE